MAKSQAEAKVEMTVYAALLRAREEFGPIVKDETADAGKYIYKYVELSSVLAAVTPALSKHGLILVQTVDAHMGNPVLTTRLVHVESGTDIVSGYPLQPARPNDPQALGGAITYARRYAIMAILGLAPEDDDGQRASRQTAPAKRQAQQAEPADYNHDRAVSAALTTLGQAKTLDDLRKAWATLPARLRDDPAMIRGKDALKRKLAKAETAA